MTFSRFGTVSNLGLAPFRSFLKPSDVIPHVMTMIVSLSFSSQQVKILASCCIMSPMKNAHPRWHLATVFWMPVLPTVGTRISREENPPWPAVAGQSSDGRPRGEIVTWQAIAVASACLTFRCLNASAKRSIPQIWKAKVVVCFCQGMERIVLGNQQNHKFHHSFTTL